MLPWVVLRREDQMNPDILSKLRKLKALQERPGNEHEAAAAALRIRELLEKHNLDIGAIDLSEQEGVYGAAGERRKRPPEYWCILAQAVKELLDVGSFTAGSDSKGWQYWFFGLKANVEAARETWVYLISAIEEFHGRWKSANRQEWQSAWSGFTGTIGPPPCNRQESRAFRLGAAEAILAAIRRQKHQPAASSSTEIMRISSDLARRMEQSMRFENEKTVRPVIAGLGASVAYMHGQDAGRQIDPHGRTRKRVKE